MRTSSNFSIVLHSNMDSAKTTPTESATLTVPGSAASRMQPVPTTDSPDKKRVVKNRGGRNGAPNYADSDIDALLDVVEEVQPIGANEWSLVAAKFEMYATEVGRVPREMESLKLKFDRLSNTKKPTGDPSCPPHVRRAKRIARDILSRVNAVAVGVDSEGDEENTVDESTVNEVNVVPVSPKRAREHIPSLGSRKTRRTAGAAGIGMKRENEEAKLVGYVGDMSRAVTVMVERMTSETPSNTEENLERLVRAQIKEEMRETNETVARTNKCVEDLRSLLTQALAKDTIRPS